ncbi:hypothetical protein [Rufibacter sp. XAAS-G3-1]|uniref:hypothetical protein n=1 Tax=Rufibacter sp. XAAS-G3-1 TaxID=2729134 RepID=UPI0015E7004F|nr:hypothetical protein [Rufibacter sp. XAAS-G3-1]
MNLEIGKSITSTKLKELEHLQSFGLYEIYWLNESDSYIIAIDSKNLICSCFEFYEIDDYVQLAHMNTLDFVQRKGIGKEIMKQAVSTWTVFNLPSTNTNDRYYYIENGLSFIRRCFDVKILTEPPFKYPR